jgi:FkbM family methyltransferase
MSMKGTVKRAMFGGITAVFGDGEGMVSLPTLSGPARGMRFRLDLRSFIEPLYWIGNYEERQVRTLTNLCQPHWTIWDCGTYLGYYTALFAKRSHTVIAFEPDPTNAQRTRNNLALNGLQNATVVNAAIGAPLGEVEFVISRNTNSHIAGAFIGADQVDYSARERRDDIIRVRSISLDQALDHFPTPNLVKIDIEGAEKTALQHVERLCTDIRPLIGLELHNPECDNAAWEFGQRYRYRLTSLETGNDLMSKGQVRGPVLCTPL